MENFAVYYRYKFHGPMSMEPIKAETPEDAETKFREMYDVYEFVQYWVCTEHISGKIKS